MLIYGARLVERLHTCLEDIAGKQPPQNAGSGIN